MWVFFRSVRFHFVADIPHPSQREFKWNVDAVAGDAFFRQIFFKPFEKGMTDGMGTGGIRYLDASGCDIGFGDTAECPTGASHERKSSRSVAVAVAVEPDGMGMMSEAGIEQVFAVEFV